MSKKWQVFNFSRLGFNVGPDGMVALNLDLLQRQMREFEASLANGHPMDPEVKDMLYSGVTSEERKILDTLF